MRYTAFLGVVVLLVYATAPAAADMYDEFWVTIDEAGILSGGGTGYPGLYPEELGEWYYYQNTDWWNQWFYDGQYMPPPWHKVIHVEFDVSFGEGGWVDVAFNWSTPAWSDLGRDYPPLPPLTPPEESEWIGRFQFVDDETTSQHVIYDYTIWDYNPEWVSIDVRGYNFSITGWIEHDCIPEPASLSLLALAGVLALRRR